MANRHGYGDGGACPLVPFVDVEIGAADAGVSDADEDVVNADGRLRDVEEGEAGRAVGFDESFHIRMVERKGYNTLRRLLPFLRARLIVRL